MIRSENEIVAARLDEVCKEVHMTKHSLVVYMKFVQN
jgi:hypothetical protein